MSNNDVNEFAKALGLEITKLHCARNWTVNELAIYSKIRKQYIEKIEKGEAKRLKILHLELLSEAFGITIPELISFD